MENEKIRRYISSASMRKRRMHHLLRFVCALFLTAALTGCDTFREAFREAMSGESTRSEDPNSENYQPRYIVGIFSIVKYPRATELEKEIQALDGRTVWINTNQNFSSKNIREARMISRPGNPDPCDLQFRIDRLGKLQWQVLSARHLDEPVALVIDGVYFGSFYPEAGEEDAEWVTLRVGIDPATARGVVKFSKSNYIYYNPDTKSWF